MTTTETTAIPAALPTIDSVTLEQLTTAMQRAGYRAVVAEQNGKPLLQSAAQGLGFIVTPGNPVPARDGHYMDYSFNCLIRVEGVLVDSMIEDWNRNKRFSRLFRQQNTLVLAMDVFVAGGVPERSLQIQCELWDRLMHDFIAHLKQRAQPLDAKSMQADKAA